MNTDNIHNNNNNPKKVYNKNRQLNNNITPTPPTTTAINREKNKLKSQFQDAIVAKSDIGEFAGGYFIMPTSDQDNQKMKRPVMTMQKNTNRKKLPPTVNQLEQQIKQQQIQSQQNEPTKQHKTPTKQQQLKQQQQPFEQQQDSLFLTPTFLAESPQKTKYNNNTKQQNVNTTPLRSNSPKKVQSPTQNSCWAGGAFNNSPSPSSLPMPNFDDDEPTTVSQVDLQTLSFDLRRLLNITPSISVSES